MSEESKRARRRGCWGRVGRTLLVGVVVLVVADVAATIITGRQVDAAIAKLRAEGAPVTPAEAAPPPIPAEHNAAPLYLEVHDIIKPHMGSGVLSPWEAPPPREEGEPAPPPEPVGYRGGYWQDAEYIRGLAALLAQDARALELLDRAAVMPGCRFDVDWAQGCDALLPHLSRVRAVERFCADAIAVAAVQGDGRALGRRLRAGLAAALHVSREPMQISQMVAQACVKYECDSMEFALSRCTVPEADARAVLALVNGADFKSDLIRALKSDRALALDLYAKIRRDPSRWLEMQGLSDPLRITRDDVAMALYVRVGAPVFNRDELAYVRAAAWGLYGAHQPWPQARREYEALERWAQARLHWAVIAREMRVCVGLYPHRHWLQQQTRLNLLAGSLGLSAYKQRNGEYPEALEELSKVDWPVPQDPFAGRPMRYRREGQRYVLYSIGQDGVDDGGKPVQDWAIRRPGDEGQFDREKGDLPWQWR